MLLCRICRLLLAISQIGLSYGYHPDMFDKIANIQLSILTGKSSGYSPIPFTLGGFDY